MTKRVKCYPRRLEKFLMKLDDNGRFIYVDGFTRSHDVVTLIHKKCGATVKMTAIGAMKSSATDTCENCRLVSIGDTAKSRYSIETCCAVESNLMLETLEEEGYLFNNELIDFVSYCVRSFDMVLGGAFDIEECLDLCLEYIYDYYNKNLIGLCKCCGEITRGIDWGMFNRRLCNSCLIEHGGKNE